MTPVSFLSRLEGYCDVPALVTRNHSYSYRELVAEALRLELTGRVVAISGPATFHNVATLLAQWLRGGVAALIGPTDFGRVEIAGAETLWTDGVACTTGFQPGNRLYDQLHGEAGVVIFTSGSSGVPKAVLHRVEPWLEKVCRPGRRQKTLEFLSFDHIGGLNTLLYAFANGGTVVIPEDRSPASVWHAIREYGVELLPTTPSFLRLALLDGQIPLLPCLRMIAYGSEPMPEATLEAAKAALPGVEFHQQYGMSELGVLRSRSREDGSNWVRLGGSEFDLRVVDGLLEVRADTAMVGYLNAPSPFTEDGWLRTGDEAEQDGEFLRIKGRRSDTINVGGEKVHPAEVEAALEAIPGVLQAAVSAEANPLLGQVVVASVRLADEESIDIFRIRMREQLRGRLPRHAIPQRVKPLPVDVMDRGKKIRRLAA